MDYTKLTDNLLMDLIRTRDVDGFDTLRLRYKSTLYHHLNSVVHDSESAEDLLQETFLRVWTRSEQWDGRGGVKAWLFKIGTNLALNSLRSPKHRKETPLDFDRVEDDYNGRYEVGLMADPSEKPELAFELSQTRSDIRRLVNELPEEKRELIRLVYESEMEIKEAAEIMGIPEGTAKSRLFYSTRYLSREWRNQEDE